MLDSVVYDLRDGDIENDMTQAHTLVYVYTSAGIKQSTGQNLFLRYESNATQVKDKDRNLSVLHGCRSRQLSTSRRQNT